jgi:hypothetical protein
MGRIPKFKTNVERQAAYRERQKLAGLRSSTSSSLRRLEEWKERNATKSKNTRKTDNRQRKESKMFIALDGEGITDKGDCYNYVSGTGKNKREKLVPRHLYTLLSASTGDYIEDYKGLSTAECFDYLLDLAWNNTNCFFVGYYFNYDVNMILKDLSEAEAKILWEEGEVEIEGYKITWLPSKIFGVSKDYVQFCLYDVSGFFQKSFIKALQDNKIEVPEEIIRGKEDRSKFTENEKEEIRKYNHLECKLLVELMNKLRSQMIECGFLPDKWHGSGAIASTIFQKYKIKDHNYTPNQYKQEIVSAYFGGRNQMLKMGEIGDCWIHDINSAYPAAMRHLPTARGVWVEQKNPKQIFEWGLHYVKWNIKDKKARLTPFPFRTKQNRICWTLEGEGWYWSPEVIAAKEFYGEQIKILRTIQFYPESDCKPFDFINDLYSQRQYLVSIGSDAQLPLKLGLNSLYGKAAQSIGYKGHRPAFQNYFWAGYITSETRATMFSLAMTNPDSVVFFATDGVVSKEKLIDSDQEKILGGWDVKQLTNFFALQSGVYCFDSDERKYKSRGFNYRSVDYDQVRKVWRSRGIDGTYEYAETRFVGLGIALATDFNLWGRWQEQERVLNFMPVGQFDQLKNKIWTNIDIYPPSLDQVVSESYKPKGDWWESDNDKEYLSLLDQPMGF